MKKIYKLLAVIVAAAVMIGGTAALLLGGKMSSAYVHDFSLTEDGRIIVLEAGVASSAGYIRAADYDEQDGKLYVTFYKTFGVNNPVGARSKFPIEVNGCTEIYVWRGSEAGFVKTLVLEDGEWGFIE